MWICLPHRAAPALSHHSTLLSCAISSQILLASCYAFYLLLFPLSSPALLLPPVSLSPWPCLVCFLFSLLWTLPEATGSFLSSTHNKNLPPCRLAMSAVSSLCPLVYTVLLTEGSWRFTHFRGLAAA